MTFPSYWECHHPNWRTPSFFRGVGWPPPTSYCKATIVAVFDQFQQRGEAKMALDGIQASGYQQTLPLRPGTRGTWLFSDHLVSDVKLYPDRLLCTSSKWNNPKLTGAKRREWGNDPLANYQYLSIIISFPSIPIPIPYYISTSKKTSRYFSQTHSFLQLFSWVHRPEEPHLAAGHSHGRAGEHLEKHRISASPRWGEKHTATLMGDLTRRGPL